MNFETLCGVLIPFAGTALGALCALGMKRDLRSALRSALSAFAAGVMLAASVWSLLLPALEQSASLGRSRFVPAVLGFWLGVFFLSFLDRLLPLLHGGIRSADKTGDAFRGAAMLLLAVTIHNIPEGMAVGAVYASLRSGACGISPLSALTLSLGIAAQNFPEGAIVSLPLREAGLSGGKAVFFGMLSGAVEPIAALVMLLASSYCIPFMPYLLSFAAGAMCYVVVEELIPSAASARRAPCGAAYFTLGFTLMMALDVALG